MTLKEQITADVKDAMREGDEIKKTTLRMLLSEIIRMEIEKHKKDDGLDNEEMQQVVARAAKMRRESAVSFEGAGREDLAQKELAELEIISQYLPSQMNDTELRAIVQEVIDKVGAKGSGDIGKIMGEVMARVQGAADGSRVRTMAQDLLS